jgi:hypothetical protein
LYLSLRYARRASGSAAAGAAQCGAEHPTLSMMSRSGRKARPIPRRRLSWETRGHRQAPPVYSIVTEKICDQASILCGVIRSKMAGRALQVGYDGLEIIGLAHLYSAL